MFALQQGFNTEAVPCTREVFYQTINAPFVIGRIAKCREALDKGDRKEYDRLKRGLPAFIFQATMDLNTGRDGRRKPGHWRLQAAARLNGLVMHDYDHLSQLGLTPRGVFDSIPAHWFDFNSCTHAILLAHVTPSGDGLRLVTTADPRCTLADNQQAVATALRLKADESIKNADRISFACGKDDLLYINDIIFTLDNNDYDKTFGDFYRRGGSHAAHGTAAAAALGSDDSVSQGAQDAPVPAATPADGRQQHSAAADIGPDSTYHGHRYTEIVTAWLADNGGEPQPGDRHRMLLRLAADMRYILENSAQRIVSLLKLLPWVQQMIEHEGREPELHAIAKTVTEKELYWRMPKRMTAALLRLGIDPDGGSNGEQAAAKAQREARHDQAYQVFWKRLQPLLAPPYDCACAGVSDENKLAAVFAAGAMYCTLMTKCWYRHYDGNQQRMNPNVMLVGEPASGKSFACTLDHNIMEAMRVADEPGRQAEKQYKEAMKERASSSKAQKGDALKKPQMVIRYLPSRTSNAIFYQRQMNAREAVQGEMMPLHLYTFDSELDSSITAQSSGAWIGKHDLELKAFHNEFSGVDFANSDSVNQIIQVFYNQVTTGTQISLNRKFTARNINDGLCTRVAIIGIKPCRYQMLQKTSAALLHQYYTAQRQWGYRLSELEGELRIGRLVDAMYDYCAELAQQAGDNQDDVLDLLRKRSVFYAVWMTVPRIVARAFGRQTSAEQSSAPELRPLATEGTQELQNSSTPELLTKGDPLDLLTVEDSDLEFAQLIYDATIYWQDYFFGQMLQDSWDAAKVSFQPRNRVSKNNAVFAALKKTFTKQDMMAAGFQNEAAASMQVSRWGKCGYIVKEAKGVYRKLINEIPI